MAHSALNTVGQWEDELHNRLKAEFNGSSESLLRHHLVEEVRGAILTAAAMEMNLGSLPLTELIVRGMQRPEARTLRIPQSSVGFLRWKIRVTIQQLDAELRDKERIAAHLQQKAGNVTT